MMTLLPADFASDTWKHLFQVMEERMGELAAELANTNLSFDKTQVVRGRLAECKRLLALEPAPTSEPSQGQGLRRDESSQDDDLD